MFWRIMCKRYGLGGLAATEGPTRFFGFIFRVAYNINADQIKSKLCFSITLTYVSVFMVKCSRLDSFNARLMLFLTTRAAFDRTVVSSEIIQWEAEHWNRQTKCPINARAPNAGHTEIVLASTSQDASRMVLNAGSLTGELASSDMSVIRCSLPMFSDVTLCYSWQRSH